MEATEKALTQDDLAKSQVYDWILANYPTDNFALQMAYFIDTYNGRNRKVQATAERVIGHYTPQNKLYGSVFDLTIKVAEVFKRN